MVFVDIEKYFEFENKYKFEERNVLGEHYWDYCRIFLFFFIQSLYDNTSNIINLSPPKPNRKISLKLLKRYGLFHIRQSDILFVSDPRRYKIGSSYMSIFCDPISASLKGSYSTLTVEEPSWVAKYDTFPPHFTPTLNDDVLYVDIYEHLFRLKKWMYTHFNKKKVQKIRTELQFVMKKVKQEFDVDVSFSIDEFTEIILYFILMRKTYSTLIDKIKPKMLINAYRPTYFKTLLIGICKEKGIPVVEVQHGSINKNEPMNKKARHRANEYYLADYILCYGRKLVKDNYMDKSKLRFVGYPLLDYLKGLNSSKPRVMQDEKKYILMISQSTIGDKLAKFAAELSTLLSEQKEYTIIFKYHPNEIGRNYPCLNRANIIQIRDLENYVIEFQKYAYCQIGVYSTAIYEGLGIYLPTIIIDNMYAADTIIENISHIKQGVYFVKKASDVSSIIDSLESPSQEDIVSLWESNSLIKVKTEIQAILENFN